ncbi:MAG: SDR family NAD(P)-dependent oxidoreductase [Anaeromyxobacter sp.]
MVPTGSGGCSPRGAPRWGPSPPIASTSSAGTTRGRGRPAGSRRGGAATSSGSISSTRASSASPPGRRSGSNPQQRLLLETSWEALEDAGIDAHRLEGSRTGVFVGQWVSDFEARLFARPEELDFFMTTGSGRYAASGRLSYVLGLRGPSLTLDTACSSSLVAVHLAVQSLRSGECPLALAGGANVILQPHVTLAYSRSGMMAADGRCKFGDASGDGYVRSEGAGLVVLKRLEAARADRDRIYAVIRGSAVNNDGRSSGSMGTPSRAGQEELLRAAHRDAGVEGGRVRYVEAHGTGTRTGNPVELAAIAAALSPGRPAGRRALVGSVKTNLGHTEGAAGVAGLIKTALALHHGAIPASLHLREPNPAVAWAEAPFAIPGALAPWPEGEGTRLAGVSAFGIAGTNAHVVLEEAPPGPALPALPARRASLLPLSARSPEALRALALRHAALLEAEGGPSLGELCAAVAHRRTPLEHRAVLVAADAAGMAGALRGYAAGSPAAAEGVAQGGRPRIAFVFPGQGGQWAGMARELLDGEPAFAGTLEACDRIVRELAGWSIVEQLRAPPGAPGHRLGDIDVVQPVLLAVSLAYAAWWRAAGVEPVAVVGHSMGEVGAAHLAGALDLEQAMRVVCRRSALMRRVAGRGAMALVDLSAEAAAERVRGREHQLAVAVSNGPRSSVISGEPAAVEEVLRELERDGVFCRRVQVDVASHSPQMEPLAAELARELAGLTPAPARLPLHSTTLGRKAEGAELGAQHWARNLRQPVQFWRAVSALLEDGVTAFVELGPHPVLLHAVEQGAREAGRSVTTVASGRRDEPELAALLGGLGRLWVAGEPLDWSRVSPRGREVALPRYPWQRERHWVEGADRQDGPGAEPAGPERLEAETRGWLHRLEWERSEPPQRRPGGTWLVLAQEADAGSALAEALRAAGSHAEVAPPVPLEQALAGTAGSGPEGVVVLVGEGAAPDLPVRVARALPAGGRARVWFATRGGQQVGDAGARVAVAQAALWGAARALAEELPQAWGGLVDLDPAAPPGADAALLARHLLAGDGEDAAALRGGRRLVQRLAPLPAEVTSRAVAWRKDATYLITGGLGEAALHAARYLVERGVRRLLLLGRTALPAREAWAEVDPASVAGQRIAAVRALEAAGAAVHHAAVDVGDEPQLRAFLSRWSAEGRPPIRGVLHAAGVLADRLTGDLGQEAFEAVVRPKLGGALLLDRLLPDLDAFVLFSSISAFQPQPGQAAYAAANAGLDALALDRRARGLPALSVGFGVWAGTGLVRGEAGEGRVREMTRRGLRPFPPDAAVKVLGWLWGTSAPHAAVLPADWAAFARARVGRPGALHRRLLAAVPEATSGEAIPSGPAERRAALERIVRHAVGQALKLAPDRIDRTRTLGSMGLGSLLAMELRNRLESALGRSLPASLAFNYPTIAALVEHLAGDGEAPAAAPAAAPAPAAPAVEGIAGLSDEEAALALRAGRKRGTR